MGAERGDEALDRLLRAAETLPHDPADAWELDLFRVALRIARATESEVDLRRADLALKALPERLRRPLVERATAAARREAARTAARTIAEGPSGLLGRLRRGRSRPGSGSTARDRLLRELDRDAEPGPSAES